MQGLGGLDAVKLARVLQETQYPHPQTLRQMGRLKVEAGHWKAQLSGLGASASRRLQKQPSLPFRSDVEEGLEQRPGDREANRSFCLFLEVVQGAEAAACLMLTPSWLSLTRLTDLFRMTAAALFGVQVPALSFPSQ